jgi:uncharacterized membrane protein
MKTNQEYKNAALAALKGNWTQAVLAGLAVVAIALVANMLTAADPEGALAALASCAIAICVTIPLSVGLYAAYRELYHGTNVKVVENSFKTGFGNWGHHVGGMLLMTVYTFAWTLLLIIPGIIKSFSYALTPFILTDKPELSANEAIELSMKMMDGHKLDLFILYLSFIGWYLLSFLTLCVGMLWVMPYQYTAMAAFYEDVKAEYESTAVVA